MHDNADDAEDPLHDGEGLGVPAVLAWRRPHAKAGIGACDHDVDGAVI